MTRLLCSVADYKKYHQHSSLSWVFPALSTNGVYASCHDLCLPSFVVVQQTRIYWERFDLELPNLTRTPRPSCRVTPEMTSLATSVWKFCTKTVENAVADGAWSNFSKTIKARITKFHALIGSASSTELPIMTSLAACFRSAAKKWVKWVRPAKSLIVRPLFNLESPNTGTPMPTYSTATLDMASPATSGRHLSRL